jgi:hypothetical protein
MKKLLILFVLLSSKVFAFQSDTTIVEFVDKDIQKKVKIVSKDGERFVYPKVLSLRNVLKAFNVDSLEREKAYIIVSKDNSQDDTLVLVNRSGNSISVTSRKINGNVIRGGENDDIKTYEPKSGSKDFDIQIFSDSDGPRTNRATPGRYFKRSNFDLYLGLNSYTNQNDDLTDLRVWPSRYIALAFKKNITLAHTEKTHLVLNVGPEFAWHNFMLKNSNKLVYENGKTEFRSNTEETSKSKFVVPHLNFPVMLNIGFKKERFHLGLGGYVGYRTGGYTKEKFASNKNKQFVRDESLGLNNVKYGLTAEVGKKNGSALFIRYDLSPLFRSTQTHLEDMSAFSFGIKL